MKIIGAIWGAAGVTLLITTAIYRLTPKAIDAIQSGLTTFQWIALVLWSIFMLISEGYRGFQKKFSPRTAARVKHLHDHPRPLHVLLAPFFCMGYFHATKKTRIVSICLTAGIALLVIAVSFVSQPWRGIIDTGVVLGLAYGISSFFIFLFQAFTNPAYPHSPETPHQEAENPQPSKIPHSGN